MTGGDGLNCNLTISAFTTKGEYIIVFSDAKRYGHLPIYCAGEIAEIKNKTIEVRGKMYKLKGFSSLIAKKTRQFNKKYKKEAAEIFNSMKAAKNDSAKIHWIMEFRRNDYNAFLYFKTIIEDTTQSQELRSEALDNGVRYIRHDDVPDFAAKYLKEFPREARWALAEQNNPKAGEILRKAFISDTLLPDRANLVYALFYNDAPQTSEFVLKNLNKKDLENREIRDYIIYGLEKQKCGLAKSLLKPYAKKEMDMDLVGYFCYFPDEEITPLIFDFYKKTLYKDSYQDEMLELLQQNDKNLTTSQKAQINELYSKKH